VKYKLLRNTAVFVSQLCLGGMSCHAALHEVGGLDQKEPNASVDVSLDAGPNLIDTANVDAGGELETLLGEAIRSRRNYVECRRSGPAAEPPNAVSEQSCQLDSDCALDQVRRPIAGQNEAKHRQRSSPSREFKALQPRF
jgi:aryl-alcohol dehydrogenase-like predicted oxidoreductase